MDPLFPYTSVDLTTEINRIPNMYGRVGALGVFPADPVATTYVEVQFRDGLLSVLPAVPRGSPGPVEADETERGYIVKVPHANYTTNIKPQDLQNRFTYGTKRRQVATLATKTAEKLANIRRRHAITLEAIRMEALKGRMMMGDRSILYDWYEVFGLTRKVVDFDLGNPGVDVQDKCWAVTNHLEDEAKGETVDGVHALVSQEFFAKLTRHPSVEKYYVQHQAALALAGDRERQVFRFGGIDFEVYRGQAPDATGVSRRFIEPGRGHAWPLGTMETFRTHFAPADHVEMVNTDGIEVFVSPKVLDHGKGVELYSETNPLAICRRPELLVELITTT